MFCGVVVYSKSTFTKYDKRRVGVTLENMQK